jgi:tRNA pseudouridine38-40 synthase
MARRLKLIVAYDGTPFAGWQSQTHKNTIQDHLEHAFERAGAGPIRVHGAGRTDAGVHALAQCAHVDLAKTGLSAERWTGALNAFLPQPIRVLRCRYVSEQFHARFAAKGKIYRYRIWSAPVLMPFEYGRAWHIIAPLDLELLSTAAARFEGTHDFAGFAANRGKSANRTGPAGDDRENDTVRTIRSVRVRRNGSCVAIEFDGDGFLYKMVRLIVGSTVQCALGKSSIKQIDERLDSGRIGSASVAAPAGGLFLVRVRY